ncbi:Glutathione S-transferase [Candidatus Defluviicoccus seviourii]|uniref:Glutathione S-transferase n=1 Tax=Candidatus Defluviicoccus seviourii TaxID=2565273 RepID=A0A564WFQ7_9PROT|nr:Glutathione S-transferase [Candidatus Defluviicoccus seviourii]
MPPLTLVIANKTYSSWSLRAWLALKMTGAAFEEIVVPLDQPTTASDIARHSPTGRVPVLKDGALTVWDSLAITEYLAERFPAAGLWPVAADARAHTRAVAAEMHSSFQALRQNMPMSVRAAKPGRGRTPEVMADITRIAALWQDCRARYGAAGPFLFGPFSAADCFFAPVVTRFTTYGVALDPVCEAYAAAVRAWPALIEWCAGAAAEPWRIAKYELD